MTQSKRCASCGATIPPGRNQCPVCLMQLAFVAREAGAEVPPPSEPKRARRAPPTPEELAANFPQLEILALLGEGGMGIVYRARHRKLAREVALKILPAEVLDEPAFEERFLREARALAKLDHPNIVGVYDFGQQDGRWYLLMEYVDGTNLRQMMNGGHLAPREALAIVPQICEALQYAHDEGVVHRDIKPDNVLIDRKGRVKIADFGLAKLLGRAPDDAQRTVTGHVMGTLHYMAPEQLEHPRDVDHRADIYSLGVVFYEMLTGSLPIGRFDPPSQKVVIDVRLDEIVLKTLEREPSRRYQHAVEVKTDVESVSETPVTRRAIEDAIEREVPESTGVFVSLPPPRGAAAAFTLFLLAWLVLRFGFYFGPLGYAVGAAACIGALLLAARHLRSRLPDLDHAIRSPSRWVRLDRFASVLVLAMLAALAFVPAQVSTWERGTRDYVSSEQDPRELRERLDDPAALAAARIQSSIPPGVVPARIELADVMGNPAAFRRPWLWLPCAFLWFCAASGLFVTRRHLRSWNLCWRPAVVTFFALAAAFLISWPLPHAIASVLAGGSDLRAVDGAGRVETGIEAAARNLRLALIGEGYEVQTLLQASLDLSRDGHEEVQVVRMAAQPSSPFARWDLDLSGPKRTRPHLVVTLAGTPGGSSCGLAYNAGLLSAREPERREEWKSWLDGLAQRIERE